jgi:PAS domain S-box-containing protein
MTMRAASWKGLRLLLRLLIWIAPVLAGCSSVHAQQLPIKSYTTADGLAHDRVIRIVRDSRGFLWFCTVEGLSRFDGAEFTSYGREQGLASPFVNDLLEVGLGEYWLATYGGGVVRFSLRKDASPAVDGHLRSRFKAYPIADGPAVNRVRVLCRDRAGRIWVGTEGGLFLLEERNGVVQFRSIELGLASQPSHPVQVWALLEDREGSLWVGTSAGLVRRMPTGEVSQCRGMSLPGDGLVRSLLQDREDRIWLSQQAALTVFKPQPSRAAVIQRFNSTNGLKCGTVRNLFQSTDGTIWIGSSEGVSEFDGQRFHSYAAAQGVSGGSINALAEDSDGNLWIGTDLSGALRLARNGFVSFRRSDGLPHPWIISILGNRLGELYAISGGELTINRWDGQRFTSIRPNLPEKLLRSTTAGPHAVLQDHTGEWWIPTNEGLYRWPRISQIEYSARMKPKAVYRTRNGLASDDVSGVFEDSRGDLWIPSSIPAGEGLTRWERATDTFHRYSDRDGLPAFNVPSTFCEDSAGSLWIGFWEGGLVRYRDRHFTLFTTADGVPAGTIGQIHLDQSQRLWVASSEGGLGRIEDPTAARPRFVTYTTTQGLSSNWIRCITEDRSGCLYLGTVRGVDRFDANTGLIKHYSTADGLAAAEVLVALRDSRGALWFGTFQGLSRFTPEPDRAGLPPPILIKGLRIAGVSQQVFELGETEVALRQLTPHQNQVQIDFFGLGFASSGVLRYQYKLEKPDRDWSIPGAQRTVNYQSLAAGTYHFLVRAVSTDGTVSPRPASVLFSILPPLWQRPWFITLAVLLLAGTVVTFDRYRALRTKELKAALNESQKLTRELTAQGTALRQAHRVLELEYEITSILAEAGTPADATQPMLQLICKTIGWDMGALWNLDPQTRVLHCVDVWHSSEPEAVTFEKLIRERVFPPGQGLAGRVLETGQPHWVTDVRQDDSLRQPAPVAPEGFCSTFGFPILLRGEVIGVLEFFSKVRRQPETEQIAMMATIGSDIGQLIDRKRAEEGLRESEVRFRTFAETASDAIITIDAWGGIVFVNPAVQKIFGHELAELIGEDLTLLMPEYLRHLHEAGLARYKQTGQRHISWKAVELPGLHRDGHEIPLEISFGEFSSNGHRYFTGIVRDVSERKRADEALRRSREERLAELERVRRRIATDLHDDIGSSLTQISILSEVVQQRVDRQDSPITEPLSMIAGSSRELVDAMSDIVWAINPQKDQLHDLTQRMRRFAADSFTARNIKFQLLLPPAEVDVTLGANLRREVFLIFKEGINNIMRHSGCSETVIELSFAEGWLRLRLRDNGHGFDLARESEGHGLASMRDRAYGIGGEFTLNSQPGHGTTIQLDVPLDPPPESAG